MPKQDSTGADVSADEDTHPEAESIDPRLVIVSESPLNAELPLALQQGVITPTSLFFCRNRFERPVVELGQWRLQVDGAMDEPFALRYEELIAMPSRTVVVTLECAGNGRSAFSPAAEGEPWGYGAVSTAEWTGIPLVSLLERAELGSDVCEILAVGADAGTIEGRGPTGFERSLPLEKALDPDTLVAYVMNGEPLTPGHGFPARLLVPGWYGIASVKWLSRISALTEPFAGYFQRERYVLLDEDGSESLPVTAVAPRSLIVSPQSGEEVPAGHVPVAGVAWSGLAPVDLVEVSADDGETWRPAQWTSEPEPHAWRTWELWWEATPGDHELQSRVTDAASNTQAAVAAWNRLGYMNNAIQRVSVRCVQRRD